MIGSSGPRATPKSPLLEKKLRRRYVPDNVTSIVPIKKDVVNSPSHYVKKSGEAIDFIEEIIADAPDPVLGSLHSHMLGYLLRLWLKENPLTDAKKAQWYLNRMIQKLEAAAESDE